MKHLLSFLFCGLKVHFLFDTHDGVGIYELPLFNDIL